MISPHGDELINRFCKDLKNTTTTIQINQSIEIDVNNIATWWYSPLIGFCRKKDFECIIHNMCISNGILWSIPIICDISESKAKEIKKENLKNVSLLNAKNIHVATLLDLEIYAFDKKAYCLSVFGTVDNTHPWVQTIEKMGEFLIGGELEVLEGWKVKFEDINQEEILTPWELRATFKEKWFQTIVAFQTRNVPHRGHEYIQKCGLENVDALLIHPVIGEKKSWDFQNHVILGSYKILTKKYYNPERVIISCLPWVMRYAWPKEAILHAIIRQNFGCSHFIVGRDHAWVGNYYGSYDAHKIFDTISSEELKISILRYENAAYCPQVKSVVTDKTSPSRTTERIFISGTKFRAMLSEWIRPPEEFIRPEVIDYLLSEKNIFID